MITLVFFIRRASARVIHRPRKIEGRRRSLIVYGAIQDPTELGDGLGITLWSVHPNARLVPEAPLPGPD